jgi:hypothetical protein
MGLCNHLWMQQVKQLIPFLNAALLALAYFFYATPQSVWFSGH